MNPTITRLESEVRSYSRSFPAVFNRASGAEMFAEGGRRYIDFFAGAGALNYGHNNPILRDALVEYIQSDGLTHGLDLATEAKCAFLDAFEARILSPRELDYKVMFPGPTGTNAVEAAIKLARKITGRRHVVAFTNGFHGMTLGALALTGNASKRGGAGVALNDVYRMPFDGYLGDDVDTLDYLAAVLADPSSGIDAPAAFVVETVQGEGGINVASRGWLQRLHAIAREHDALLIVDDIQMGCGRTGPFFSFEDLGVVPDMVTLSKSLSGYGLPFALTLFRPELDAWKPGEHNGTFRGNNLAFVTATAALDAYWNEDAFEKSISNNGAFVAGRLERIAERYGATVRGRGMVQALAFEDRDLASKASAEAFERGLIIETSGSFDEVLKLLPPLTIEASVLAEGLDLLEQSVAAAAQPKRSNGLAEVRA